MQIELKRLQHEVGITFVVVTHDQEEALTMADRVAVLSLGRVLQVGTPIELYDRPVNHFVAAFIGKTNFLRGVVAAGGISVAPYGTIAAGPSSLANGTDAYLAIRPESAHVLGSDDDAAPGHVALPAVVEAVAFVGSQVHSHLRLEGSETAFVVTSSTRHGLHVTGEHLRVAWPIDDARILAD